MTQPVFNAGTGKVVFDGGNKTVNAPATTFNNVDINTTQYYAMTVVGTLNVAGDVNVVGGVYSSLNGGTVAVGGNLTTTNATFQGTGTFPSQWDRRSIVDRNDGRRPRPPARAYHRQADVQSTHDHRQRRRCGRRRLDLHQRRRQRLREHDLSPAHPVSHPSPQRPGNELRQPGRPGGASSKVSPTGNLDVKGSFALISTATNGPVTFVAPPVMSVAGDFTAIGTLNANNVPTTQPVFNAGTGKVVFDGGNKTVNAPATTFNNVDINTTQYYAMTVVGSLNVARDVNIGNGVYTSLDGGTVAVGRNLTTTNATFQGTGTFLFNGTGDQSLIGTAFSGAPGRRPAAAINKTKGTLSMAETSRSRATGPTLLVGRRVRQHGLLPDRAVDVGGQGQVRRHELLQRRARPGDLVHAKTHRRYDRDQQRYDRRGGLQRPRRGRWEYRLLERSDRFQPHLPQQGQDWSLSDLNECG